MKRLKQYSFWEYMRVLLVFIAGLAVSLLVFSYNVQVRTEQNVEELLDYNTDHQQSQLKFMLNTQFIYLGNIADYVAKEDSLMCEKNQELLSCMTQDTLFHAISIIDTDGNGVTNDGKEQKVADRDYFKRTMKGEEVLSDPLYSSLDGKRRVVLSVPIKKNGEIIGAVAGSFDMVKLSQILFEDVYQGKGYPMITTWEGKIIAVESDEIKYLQDENLFEIYQGKFGRNRERLESARQDFKFHRKNCIKVKYKKQAYYIAYESLGYNQWMLCYTVPVSVASEEYSFITVYEYRLLGAVIVGVLIMLLVLWKLNQKKQRDLINRAQMDSMTNILNKSSIQYQINDWLQHGEKEGIQALLMLDLDQFKNINDTYGHALGDEVIKAAAKVLKDTFRSSDIVGRAGGDEFMVLMKNVRWDKVIERQLQELCRKFENLKIMILDSQKDIELFIKSVDYGIDGYILNIDDKDEFIYIIKRVLNGKKFYDSELLQYTIHNEKTNNEIDLTNREKCVLNYVCKGLSNKDIANELKVTDYTIKKHVSNILSKLHLRSRQDIILYAQDNHIIDEII